MVGTSGKIGVRVRLVTASARSLPSLICGTAGGSVPKEISVWPAIVAAIGGAPPLNGARTSARLSDRRRSSPTTSGGGPAPGAAEPYLLGVALMSAARGL